MNDVTVTISRAVAEEIVASLRCDRVKLSTSPNCLVVPRWPCSSCAALKALKEAMGESIT
jgi:deoxycytidylate deaminase